VVKKIQRKKVRADEVYHMGPLRMARFGELTVFENKMDKEDFAKMQNRAKSHLPKVIQEVDSLVGEISTLISELPPEKLLHRAWWEMAAKHARIEAEVQVGEEEGLAMRMIDYVQSIVAAVPPDPNQRSEVTDEEWALLHTKIEALFRTLNVEYQICLTANNKGNDPSFDMNFEEFKFKAQLYWMNVRGARYQVHEPAYLRDVFLPHSAILKELFNITTEEFVAEIIKIWHTLSFGLSEAKSDFDKFREESLDAIQEKINKNPQLVGTQPHDLMALVVKENGWEKRKDDILERMLGLGLFDVEKICSLPKSLLDKLTWGQGEASHFFASGDFAGWPLKIWPIFQRPFIKLGGRIYCFDLYTLLDHLYRVMEKILVKEKQEYREIWNETQKQLSEELPLKYLQKLLPGATIFRSINYRWYPDKDKKKDWCEVDGILIYDDHLFIIEAKGGAFTYTPPATDFPAYVNSLKELVLKPTKQGNRFLEYLNSDTRIPLFDRNRQHIGELCAGDFRHITICPVTLDAFTELAAQTQHLRKIGLDVGDKPTWSVSVDDLRVYADIFENPLIFLHFVEQRMRAFGSEYVQSDDEMDHVGLYLKHNNYSMHAKSLHDDVKGHVGFHGYRLDVDKFFSSRMHNPSSPNPLIQTMPDRLMEIVNYLSKSNLRKRTELSSYLLDLAGDWRDELARNINEEIKNQPQTQRPLPFSTYGNVRITVFCWTPSSLKKQDDAGAIKHTRTVMMVRNDSERLLVELWYNDAGELYDLRWSEVNLFGLSDAQLSDLKAEAEKLKTARISKARKVGGKIGRNDPCPCGSGKKYKKCHLPQ